MRGAALGLALLGTCVLPMTSVTASQQSYKYDAQGRLVGSCQVSGYGAQGTGYLLDLTGNRSRYVSYPTMFIMGPEQPASTPNRQYNMKLQSDGNFVVYNSSGRGIWATGTNGRSVSVAVMQTDGNFVLYAPDGSAVWQSGTSGHDCGRLQLQDDGNLVIVDPGEVPIWSNGVRLQ